MSHVGKFLLGRFIGVTMNRKPQGNWSAEKMASEMHFRGPGANLPARLGRR